MLLRRLLLVAVVALLVAPGIARAATVSAGAPFPSNLLTTPDASQITGLRVDLPKPDCATRPSDCADVAVLDQLDGFNVQPRLSIPFSGPIDTSTVSSDTAVPPHGASIASSGHAANTGLSRIPSGEPKRTRPEETP